MYGGVVGYGHGDLSFCAFTIIIVTHPHPVAFSFPDSVFDSSKPFFGPQWCAFLISSLLFYSFFHFPFHLFWPTLSIWTLSLFSLSLSHSLSSPPFAFLQGLSCAHHHHPSPFLSNCSFLCTLQLCCSAFRRCEYLQFCMFEKLWWARDSYHLLYVRACVCRHNLHDCVCMWVNASTWISLFMSVCVQNNPDYTHFSVSHFRKKGGEGRRRKRVREREREREMFCHHDKHPSNEQQSQISDSP